MIRGVGVDPEGRCAHWHGPTDVVALRLPCCGEWFACRECHDGLADHVAEVWPRERMGESVALCGVCKREMSGTVYVVLHACPACAHPFNPGCRLHRDLYFAPDAY